MERLLTRLIPLVAVAALLLALGCSSDMDEDAGQAASGAKAQKRYLAFGGGPTGGTFNFFANKMASVIADAHGHLEVSPKGAGGSVENLRSLNNDAVDLGIVYSGDAFLGRTGALPGDPAHYDRVRALAFLYGAPAQLVVRADSGIVSARDLKGRTVAIGNPGSGAALSAERFLNHLGLWESLTPKGLGYTQAATDFVEGRLDAFWLLVGYPNSAIIEAAARVPVRLVDLHAEAVASGFYEAYPFYTEVTIPAGTYAGQDADVATFQDASLWCASADMGEETAYDCLRAVYSSEGLEAIRMAHSAARDMAVSSGLRGISIPLHPGAVRFWKEQGLDIPEALLP
ncbi:MAG: TAXI family TRAP transporter solute-binding subunit [Pseudodesulfovibrio sp.]|uniref:TAXI family TRAP transporter solute-binding subunit n=1 Tax=Pseudodesulfovibrio TaxID=2035811 RepID=UPI001D9D2925|nr:MULTISPECIES: TAXI family TRAP transporter solute-binding subunit [Pseudodesulfovibrio]MBU4243862.1 TAXI family TRAP transporter solute-binding subunit [Pseudomonadota bacterium]MBU4377511.1 TAXI family TRAP transporter solute-binding subunit [Pseudomonadota bacterium]MBU4475398.1 TAXI family TRAP transporter solute-binding subunit [Pseudomonadota bacterium]MBU4517235.1 TAXI family TRAP transporter solute-binding subunit [Pseudomonadota bacterium]MBU4521869.1 TAXI family TRAP transporter so